MLKKLLTLATFVVAGATGATLHAQTDVTSTYIKNAGFDTSTDFQASIAVNDHAHRYDVTGWTNEGGTQYSSGGALGFSGGQINGANIPSANADGTNTGGALAIQAAWASNVFYKQEVTLPAGNYTMTFAVNNVGQNAQFEKDPVMFSFTTTTGASFSGNVHSYPTNTWTTQTITFALASETTGTIKIGYKGKNNQGSGATPKLIVDYVKAFYNSNYTETLQSTIDRATILNARANDNDLAAAITTAQGVLNGADNTVAYQTTIDNAVTTLRSAISTAAAKVILLEGENITFMFENADFESSTPVTVGITTYDYDAASNGTSFSRMQVVEGWTIAENGNAKATGVFKFGENPFLGSTGTQYQAPATASATGEEKALGIVAVWSSSAQYKQAVTLPAGSYIIEVPIYNTAGTTPFSKNLIGFVEDGGTEHLATAKTYATGSWITEKIIFELANETSGYLSLGYTAAGAGSNAMPHLFIDNVKVTYTSPIAAAYQKYQDALEAANTAIANSDYANVTGSERTALQNAIDATPEATKEAYNNAADALDAAREAFTAAKSAYDGFVAAKAITVPTLDYAATAKKTALEEAVVATATSAADATAKATIITTALRAYYESHALAEGVDGAVDQTSAIAAANADTNTGWTNGIGTNQGQGYTDAAGEVASKYLDGGWAQNAGANIDMTRTVSVPAGKYLLTVTARGSVDLTEYTLSIGGKTIDLPHTNGSSNGVFGNGWDDASVEFESDGTDQTLEIIAKSTVSQQWISLNRFRLVRLELYTEMAKAEDYEALNTAIAAAEAKTLGFEDGEYAPYNNVKTIEALATAKALDQTTENSKDEVVALTSALGVWNPNNGEVDGIYNGDLNASVPNETSGVNVDMPGWTSVQGMRMVIGDAATDPGLEYTSAKKALFSWGGTTLTYGEKAGYTLPLKANTVYEVTYLISAWRDGDFPTYTSVNVGGKIYEKYMTVPGKINDAEGNPFKQMTFKFVTGEAGDYVVKLSGNKHFVVSDISLRKVATEPFNGTTIAATDKYGTFISPIARELPTGLKAYTVDGVEENGTTLTLTSVDAIAANTPVVLENTTDAAITLEAKDGQSLATEETYKTGLLTGVLALNGIMAPANSYVLQNQDNVVAFYKVDATAAITVPAYRAYLTAPANGANVRGFFFPEAGEATGIAGIEVLTSGNYDAIYTAGGAKVNSLQKGLNIVVKDGKSYKIFVK